MPRAVLTPRLVDTLRPQDGRARTVYFDSHRDAPKGFALRVTSKGARGFYLLATLKSSGRKWIHLGDARRVGLDAARRAARIRAGELAMGRNPTAEARAARAKERAQKLEAATDDWTVTAMLREYVKAQAKALSPVTIKEYERQLAHDIEPSDLGALIARRVVKDDVRRFTGQIGKRAPALAYRELTLIRAAFRWALDEETIVTLEDGRKVARSRVDRDPTRRIEDELPAVRAAGRRESKRHLTDEQIPAFWKAMDTLPPSVSTFARLVLLCATRRTETARARWPDFEMDGPAPILRLPAPHRKGRVEGNRGARRELVVPLPPLAVELLREYRNAPGPSKHSRVPPTRGDQVFRRAPGFSLNMVNGKIQKASGFAVSLHDLRRSCTTGLQRIGAPPHVISVVLGHAREEGATATDTAYTHDPRTSEHRLWLERWALHVLGLVSGNGGATLRPESGAHQAGASMVKRVGRKSRSRKG